MNGIECLSKIDEGDYRRQVVGFDSFYQPSQSKDMSCSSSSNSEAILVPFKCWSILDRILLRISRLSVFATIELTLVPLRFPPCLGPQRTLLQNSRMMSSILQHFNTSGGIISSTSFPLLAIPLGHHTPVGQMVQL